MLDTGQNIITRQLPKTGQITSYRAGDDGEYEAGWWKSRLNANNRNRWIAKTISGDDIVLDRATGLMWPQNFNLAGGAFGNAFPWNAQIDYCNNLIFAGFDDWRMPNLLELQSICDYNIVFGSFWYNPPFIGFMIEEEEAYWTSTSVPWDTTEAFILYNNRYLLSINKSDNDHFVVAVRKGI